MSSRKVLVTGISMISPLGVGKTANWNSVLNKGNAIRKLQGTEFTDIDCKIGGMLTTDVFDPADHPTSFGFRASSLAAALAS